MVKKPTTEEMLREFARKRVIWKKNPSLFFNEVLGITLPLHQKRMLETICNNNRITIKSANSCGKSFIVGATAFWYFFTNVSKLPDNDTIIINLDSFIVSSPLIYIFIL